jgi:hypothetical protein
MNNLRINLYGTEPDNQKKIVEKLLYFVKKSVALFSYFLTRMYRYPVLIYQHLEYYPEVSMVRRYKLLREFCGSVNASLTILS